MRARSMLVAALCGGAMLLPGVPASATEGVGIDLKGWLPGIQDSRELGTATLVSGKVNLPSERGPAEGALVYLRAWPSEEVMSRLKPGDKFRYTMLAKTVTNANGDFALRLGVDVRLSHLASRNGTVDLDVVAEHTTGISVHGFSVSLGENAATKNVTRATVDARTGHVTRTATPVDINLLAGSKTDQPEASKYNKSDGCYGTEGEYVADMGTQWVTVGHAGINTWGATASFTYTNGSSSELGAAFSVTGTYGSFSSSGTYTRSSSSTVGFPSIGDYQYRYFNTKFRYGKFYFCAWLMNGYQIRATTYAGGTWSEPGSGLTTNYCVPQTAGSWFIKNSTAAITWTNGASLQSVIGIDLSSKTGFTSSTSVRYDFQQSRHLCGSQDYPGGSARILQAKA